ncbi:hypothetical protein KY334_00440 [Candidatus Woesearchaeota archaeon]|nr:hypothetical protein [Candidatus Woesearchaeota archaeon]
MTNLLPQDMQVRYLFPLLRKETAKQLQKKGLKQKDISSIMGLTEGAVSQYLKDKRGTELKLSEDEITIIEKSIKKLIDKKIDFSEWLFNVSKKIGVPSQLCKIHRSIEKVPAKCKLCEKLYTRT